jgi:hypothetical protein
MGLIQSVEALKNKIETEWKVILPPNNLQFGDAASALP